MFLIGAISMALFSCTRNTPESGNNDFTDSALTLHHAHHAHYSKYGIMSEKEWDSLHGIAYQKGQDSIPSRNNLHKVFGWHPHYMGSSYKSYNYGLLWGISYFSYLVNPSTGSYKTIYDWKTTQMVELAKEAGTKVFLTASNFGSENNSTFLGSNAAQQRFTDSIIALLDARDADGVTLDFEGLPEHLRTSFTSFVLDLSSTMKTHNPQWMVTITLPGIIKNKAFDIAALKGGVDLFLVMGYDYYYAHSPDAGPVAPLRSGDTWDANNLETSVNDYVREGLPKEKLILSLPYYGRKWKTSNAQVPSPVLKSLGSVLYRTMRTELDPAAAQYDQVSQTKYMISDTLNGTAQLWFDDHQTLGAKYDWVLESGIAGVGIWALGYDNGYSELWNVLEEKFGE